MSARDDYPTLVDFCPHALDDLDRFRTHSVILNTVAWRIHDALGLIAEGCDTFTADIESSLPEACRLIALGREIEWEIDKYGDPCLMGIRARCAAHDGFTQNELRT